MFSSLLSATPWMCFVAACVVNFALVTSNNMDPHVYPQKGPFFEGWYLRVIDRNEEASFGFLFALILPGSQNNATKAGHLLCASLLLNPKDAPKLDSPTGCFDPKDYSVLKNGKPVTQNPDDKTPPNFTVKLGSNITYIVTPGGSEFSVSIGDHKLEGKTSSPVPWGPGGEGPESWLEKLPLPIHWFVYSFRSTVKEYSYTNSATGHVTRGGSSVGKLPVVAHMEKNWGQTFNEAWIWAEGVDPTTNVSFAFAAGLIRELFLDIPAQLSGYRNPNKRIDCSFDPVNSVHTLVNDGCEGTATLDVRGIDCHVIFHLSAARSTFSDCLVTPQNAGFELGCYESYVATANITAYAAVSGEPVVDHQIVKMSGLEFGAKYMCNEECPKVVSSQNESIS